MHYKLAISIVGLLSLSAKLSIADDWRQFRGPSGNGLVQEEKVPEVWSPEANIKWQTRIPGEGWSAPIIVGKKVFITTAISSGEKNKDSVHDWQVQCLDADTGKLLWSKVVIQSKPRLGTHRDNTYASETPVSDGKYVVAYFGMMGLFCYDLEGNEIWKKDLGNFPMQNEWGTSSSPIIHNNSLYVQVDNEKQSFLLALDLATGEEKWRKGREESSNWGSPILWKNALRTELVTAGKFVRSYNPEDGSLLWEISLNAGGVSSTPSGNDDLLIVGNQGRQGAGILAIKAGASGDISFKAGETSNEQVLWSSKEYGPQRSSPVVYDGKVFLLGQRGGQLSCIDAKTGNKLYQERLPDAAPFWASPWVSKGLVYCPDENGKTFVVKPGPKLELVRVNKLPAEGSARYWATSAAAEGTLFIRSSDTLYAVSSK